MTSLSRKGCHAPSAKRSVQFMPTQLPQSERSWDLFAGERYRRGETDIPSYEAYNSFRHRQQGPYA